jgi:hypothetical protein
VNLTISPPIRIAAIAGLLLAVVFGGYTMTLGRSHSSSAAQTPARTQGKTVTTHRSVPPATAASATPKTAATRHKTHAAAAKTATAAKTTTAKTAVKHRAAKHTAAKHTAARRGNLVDATLPQALQWQLSQHKVVVVSVYDPNASVDAISVAEAHAGAVEAGAGFLLVNVLDDSLAGLLTGVLPGGGLLPDPGVLIYRTPGTLALRIDGFADRDAIAQAATNALAGQDGPTTASAAPTITTP